MAKTKRTKSKKPAVINDSMTISEILSIPETSECIIEPTEFVSDIDNTELLNSNSIEPIDDIIIKDLPKKPATLTLIKKNANGKVILTKPLWSHIVDYDKLVNRVENHINAFEYIGEFSNINIIDNKDGTEYKVDNIDGNTLIFSIKLD